MDPASLHPVGSVDSTQEEAGRESSENRSAIRLVQS